jgi:hypothetical protein
MQEKAIMSCKQLPLLQRLSVEYPAVLGSPAWKAHLEECEECRRERRAMERSLAVFRHFESQPPPAHVTGPSWESVSQAVARSTRQRARLRVRVPLAAASLLVAVSSGVLLWPVTQGPELPLPARIVTLQPDQQAQLSDVLHSSLQADSTARPEALATAPAEAPVFTERSVDPAAAGPRATFAEDSTPVSEVPASTGQDVFGRPDAERAPVLLFRSLQQRRSRQEPIPVIPVFAPVHSDLSGLLPRGLLMPRPIR